MKNRRAVAPSSDDGWSEAHVAWLAWTADHGLPSRRIPMGASFTVDDENQLIAYDVMPDRASSDPAVWEVEVHAVGHPIAPFPVCLQPDAKDHAIALHAARAKKNEQ